MGKHIKSCAQIYNCDIYQPPLLSNKGMDVDHFPKLCVSGEFVPLYSWLRTLREQYRTMVAPLLVNSDMVKYEAVLHSCGTNL